MLKKSENVKYCFFCHTCDLCLKIRAGGGENIKCPLPLIGSSLPHGFVPAWKFFFWNTETVARMDRSLGTDG